MVEGPSAPDPMSFDKTSITESRISGAEEPSAIRVRLATVGFQMRKCTILSLPSAFVDAGLALSVLLLAVGSALLILTALCSMFIPYFAGKMTDAVTIALTGDPARAKRKATEAFYGILTVSILGGVFQTARSYLFNTASYNVVARLRNRLFSNILRQEVGFFDSVTSGSLISRLTADTNLLKNVATQNLSMFLRGLATAIIGLAFMFLTSYRLTLVVIAAFPPLIFVAMWQGRRLRNLSKETQAALAEATAVAEDSLGAIRTVRGFAREDGEAEHFAAVEASKSALWLARMLAEVLRAAPPTVVLYEDNQACIHMANNPVVSARNRHFVMRMWWLRDQVAAKTIAFRHVPTKHQLADILTKVLPAALFRALCDVLFKGRSLFYSR